MEKKRKGAAAPQAEQAQQPRGYRREQLLGMEKYRKRTDLLMALLRPEKRYTLEAVDRKIDEFMKRRA